MTPILRSLWITHSPPATSHAWLSNKPANFAPFLAVFADARNREKPKQRGQKISSTETSKPGFHAAWCTLCPPKKRAE